MWQVLGDKCVAGSAAWVSWWAKASAGLVLTSSCWPRVRLSLPDFAGANTSSVTMLCERLSPRPLKSVQSPKRVRQNQQTGPGDSGCTWFLQPFRPGPHHFNPFHEFKTKEIDKSTLFVDWKSYVSQCILYPNCQGIALLGPALGQFLKEFVSQRKVVESCLPEVEVWPCRAPLCNLTNGVSTKGPELTSLNLWVVWHVLWYPLQQFHPHNCRVDGQRSKALSCTKIDPMCPKFDTMIDAGVPGSIFNMMIY